MCYKCGTDDDSYNPFTESCRSCIPGLPFFLYLSNRIKQCGHWAIARECCKKGVPIETFMLALMMAKKG